VGKEHTSKAKHIREYSNSSGAVTLEPPKTQWPHPTPCSKKEQANSTEGKDLLKLKGTIGEKGKEKRCKKEKRRISNKTGKNRPTVANVLQRE